MLGDPLLFLNLDECAQFEFLLFDIGCVVEHKLLLRPGHLWLMRCRALYGAHGLFLGKNEYRVIMCQCRFLVQRRPLDLYVV